MSEATYTLFLRVPDDVALSWAVPGDDAIPADHIGIPLAQIPALTTQQQGELRRALDDVSELDPLTVSFDDAAKSTPSGVIIPLSTDSASTVALFRTAAREALDYRNIPLDPLSDDITAGALVSRGTVVPAALTSVKKRADVSLVSLLLVASDGRSREFSLQPLPGSAAPRSRDYDALTAAAQQMTVSGRKFHIPVVVPEGVPTGDGRLFRPLSLTTRDLPLPLLWQIKTSDGHDGSVVVGRIDSVERTGNGLGNAYGVFDTGTYGREAQRLVETQMLRGISADLDQLSIVGSDDDEDDNADEKTSEQSEKDKDNNDDSTDSTVVIDKARLLAITIVAKPAFQECSIELMADSDENDHTTAAEEHLMEEITDETVVACAMIASSIPVTPPQQWFDDPQLREPSPLTVGDDGRVFGHIALWHVAHLGMPGNTRPPRSRSNYAYFRTGVLRTAEGSDINVGQLTLAGGHAGLELSAKDAAAHYDETNSAVADVTAGEDAFGIWVAGALRPGVTPEQVRAFRAASPSGDWRPIEGRLELVAVCQVNVPGFPVARARVASGYVTALVAAGASAVAQLSGPTVADRLSALEQQQEADRVSALATQLRTKFTTLAAGSDEAALFKDYSEQTRTEYAQKGWALPDGSFPISTTQDIRNAIRAFNRVPSDNDERRTEVRDHIVARAHALGKSDLLPDAWGQLALEFAAQQAILQVQATVASLRFRKPFDESKHLRDRQGKFREKLARLHRDMIDSPGAEKAAESLIKAEQALEEGRLDDAEQHAHRVEKTVARFEKGALDRDDALKNSGADAGGALAEVVSGNEEGALTKYRYTDLPPTIIALIDSLIDEFRVQAGDAEVDESLAPMLSYMSGNDLATVQEIQSWISEVTAHLLALRKTSD